MRLLVSLAIVAGTLPLGAQDVPLEYRVKAACLYNFLKYIDWPDDTADPFTIWIAAGPYIRTARGMLTVGDTPDFIPQGGVIAFVQDGGNVRFRINDDAAVRAGLQISARLLRLSPGGPAR